MEHFTDIASQSNELLMLSHDAMVEIISSDDLNVKNEEIVFESIIRWINHDPSTRRQHIAPLLRCIRLGLLSTQYFVETVKVTLATESIRRAAKKYNNNNNNNKRHSQLNDILWRAFKRASVPAVKEPAGLSRDDGRRPNGVTLLPWAKGKPRMGCHSTGHLCRLPPR